MILKISTIERFWCKSKYIEACICEYKNAKRKTLIIYKEEFKIPNYNQFRVIYIQREKSLCKVIINAYMKLVEDGQ